MKLEIDKTYKWMHDDVILVFIGKHGPWNQFSLNGSQDVWCEVLDSDLRLMEQVS